MDNFIIHFLICNIYITIMIAILATTKRLFKNVLSSRMHYNLWLFLTGLLALPLLPIQQNDALHILFRFSSWNPSSIPFSDSQAANITTNTLSGTSDWMNDFALSISKNTSSAAILLLWAVWITGMFFMFVFFTISILQLKQLKNTSLPVQDEAVLKLYRQCQDEMHITKPIPLYSTPFLESPVIIGFIKPCIIIPLSLISDCTLPDLRYMLLHELQHDRHKDAFGNYLMNIATVIYWFNPAVWYVCKEMRNDRELACDTSVLRMLKNEEHTQYGHTLINYAEKLSFSTSPFTAGIGGNEAQIKKRILNIVSYRKTSFHQMFRSIAAFIVAIILLLCLSPGLLGYASDNDYYHWNNSGRQISQTDLSEYFGNTEGSFVLYDPENDLWTVHDMERATLRVSPDSSYKVYDALFGLEEGIITPEDSTIEWDHQIYPFESWNTSQDLSSAMEFSVNWYFQEIDRHLGRNKVLDYITKINYGNKSVKNDLSTYWLESSLKISPVEQVLLLTDLYNNRFGFAPENIQTVKNALHLSDSEGKALYGKTGTGRVNGQDINGWFVGYVEDSGHPYFFAVNITADSDANGSTAAEIALSILSDLGVWN